MVHDFRFRKRWTKVAECHADKRSCKILTGVFIFGDFGQSSCMIPLSDDFGEFEQKWDKNDMKV